MTLDVVRRKFNVYCLLIQYSVTLTTFFLLDLEVLLLHSSLVIKTISDTENLFIYFHPSVHSSVYLFMLTCHKVLQQRETTDEKELRHQKKKDTKQNTLGIMIQLFQMY